MKTLRNNGPGIHSQAEAIELLNPHLPNISGSIEDGWDAWERFGEREPDLRMPLDATARANFIYCHIVESARRRFEGIKGVLKSTKGRVLKLTFAGRIVLRFKKLDAKLRSSGIPTQQYLQFLLQRCLPGFEQTNVIGGYRLDGLKVGMEDIHVTCPHGSRNHWTVEIPTETCTIIETVPSIASEETPKMRLKEATKQKSKSG